MMQYEFMPPKGAVDAVFIPRRLLKCFDLKTSYFMFVDLVNAFDQVQREVIRFALRRKGVSEYLVNEVMPLHLGCKSAV